MNEEAAAPRGGLRARLRHVLANAAIVRLVTLTVGLATLGFLGQCLATPARASAPLLDPITTVAPVKPASSASAPTPATPVVPEAREATTNANGSDASVVAAEDPRVELNTAKLEDLRRLPGIGPRRASAILELRAKLGGFRRLEDLMRVRGLGRGAMKRLRPLVTINTGPPKN